MFLGNLDGTQLKSVDEKNSTRKSTKTLDRLRCRFPRSSLGLRVWICCPQGSPTSSRGFPRTSWACRVAEETPRPSAAEQPLARTVCRSTRAANQGDSSCKPRNVKRNARKEIANGNSAESSESNVFSRLKLLTPRRKNPGAGLSRLVAVDPRHL